MSDKRRSRLPVGEGAVPDKALEELLAAFANDAPTEPVPEVDDPSIDRLLDIPADDLSPTVASAPAQPEPPVAGAPVPVEPVAPVRSAIPDEPAVQWASTISEDLATQPVPTTAAPSTEPETEPDTAAPETAAPETAAPETAARDTVAPEAAGPGTPAPEAVAPEPESEPEPVVAAPRTTIKIGGDDELPDALYLDEEAGDRLRGSERSTEASVRQERTTILIADDDIEGAAGGIPVATGPSASMDPRLRARRIAVKRAVGRRRLRWFVLGGAVIIILTAVLAVLGSGLFAVQRSKIEISGVDRMSPTDLDAAVNRLAGHPVLLIDTHSIEAQLKRSPWVRDARVTTDFPHSASIEILERVPLATYQGADGRFRIIDVEGQVVDVIQGQPVEFMLVTGSGVNASAGTSAGASFTHAAELVEALSPAVRSRTKSVTVGDDGALGLVFNNGAKVTFGAPTELLDKLTRLEAFLKRSEGEQCTTTLDVTTVEPACSKQ